MTRAGRWAALLALAVLLTAVPATAHATKTVGLSSGKFQFTVAPGEGGSGELTVMNNGDEPLRVLVYAANQTVGKDGEATYQVPGRDQILGSNPAGWLSIKTPDETQTLGNVPVIDLAVGESRPVEFQFTVPADAPPGDHQIILFFEMMGDDVVAEQPTAQVVGRVGARIQVRVLGEVVERLEVRPFFVRSLVIGDTCPYSFVLRNEGNTDESFSTRIVVLDGRENEVSSSVVATESVVYAGSMSEFNGSFDPGIALGRFTARLVVDYLREGETGATGVPDSLIEERTVWIVPLWLVVVLIVAVGSLLIFASWRQAKNAAKRKAIEARRRAAREIREAAAGSPDEAS